MEKILIVYYSFEGNTKFIAEAIAKELGADIQALEPSKEPKSKGFSKYIWGGRQVAMKSVPELSPLEKNPEDYDVVILGTPVWSFTFTPALRAFFINYPMKNKKIALFCCHDGSPKKTLANMEEHVSGNKIIGKLDIKKALEIEPEQKKSKAIEWARNILNN